MKQAAIVFISWYCLITVHCDSPPWFPIEPTGPHQCQGASFICKGGRILPCDNRCNGKQECDDNTDEEGCRSSCGPDGDGKCRFIFSPCHDGEIEVNRICDRMSKCCIKNGKRPLPKEECKDGEYKPASDGCNGCHCIGGFWGACTRKRCLPTTVKPRFCLFGGILFHNGDSWLDDCNRCTCNDGLAVCTKKMCLPKGVTTTVKPKACKTGNSWHPDGDSWMEDCNQCTCDNGLAFCTMNMCPPEVVSTTVKPVCLHPMCPMDDCTPEYYEDDNNCKACRCKEEGPSCGPNGEGKCRTFFLTDLSLTPCLDGELAVGGICNKLSECCIKKEKRPLPKEECKDGDYKKSDDGCNDCHCFGGGWGCTKMACHTIQGFCTWGDSIIPNGVSWMEDCNRCTCNDGLAFCTEKMCLPKEVTTTLKPTLPKPIHCKRLNGGKCFTPRQLMKGLKCKGTLNSDLECPGRRTCCLEGTSEFCGKNPGNRGCEHLWHNWG